METINNKTMREKSWKRTWDEKDTKIICSEIFCAAGQNDRYLFTLNDNSKYQGHAEDLIAYV